MARGRKYGGGRDRTIRVAEGGKSNEESGDTENALYRRTDAEDL